MASAADDAVAAWEIGLAQRLANIEPAKTDGSWVFLDDVEALIVPPELQAALESQAPALENWQEFERTAQRAILEWVKTAKRAERRAACIAKTARLAARNLRANHPEAKGS